MDSKMLSVRSFEKNQTLLSLINKLIIYLELQKLGISNDYSETEINEARSLLIQFLKSLDLAIQQGQGAMIFKGADLRERSFIRKFIDATHKPKQYKSILFKKSPLDVISLLEPLKGDNASLIEALTDLRNLITEHLSLDLRDLVGDI